MPNITPLQHSFSAGEVSPQLQLRSSSRGFREGCGRLENFIADPRGPARSRPGFRFLQSAEEAEPPPALICGEVVSFRELPVNNADHCMEWSQPTDTIWCSEDREPIVGDVTAIYFINPVDNTVTRVLGGDFTTTSSLVISQNGNITSKDRIFIAARNTVSGDFSARIHDIAGFVFVDDFFFGSTGFFVIAERNDSVLVTTAPNGMSLLDKVAFNRTILSLPAGWSFDQQVGAATIDGDTLLFPVREDASGNLFFTTFTTANGANVPAGTVPIRTDLQTDIIYPLVIGGSVYWVFNKTTGPAAEQGGYILKTDLQGNETGFINATFGPQQDWAVSAGRTRLFHDTTNNAIVFLNNATVYSMDLTTEEITSCQLQNAVNDVGVPYTNGNNFSGWCQPYPGRNYVYVHLPQVNAGTLQIFCTARIRP